MYKASRRREYERLRQMDEDVKGEEEGEKWEREKREREERDKEATRKKREKRERLKRKKGGKKGDEEGDDAGGGEAKKAKFKPRVDVREGMDGLGGEGPEEGSNEVKAVEEVGVIIHDDD